MKNAATTAEKLFGKKNIKSINFVTPLFTKKFKIVVFVPLKISDTLIYKMGNSGAGRIGNYTLCSFRTTGVGTFKGSARSNPAIGKKGILQKTEEARLEMICEEQNIEKIIDTIYKYHPYEEPACEIYQIIVNDTQTKTHRVMAELKKPIKLSVVLKKLNTRININLLNAKMIDKKVQRIFIDESRKRDFEITPHRMKTLVLRRIKNNFALSII